MSNPYCKIVYGVVVPDDKFGEDAAICEGLRATAIDQSRRPDRRWRSNIPKFDYVYCGLHPYGGFHYVGIEMGSISRGCNPAHLSFVSPTESQKADV